MTQSRLHHYLRTYRRRSGLSQEELSILLGASSGTKVSRYESFRRRPSVPTVFAYEIIFNAPVRDLFAGFYETVRRDVAKRAGELLRSAGSGEPDGRDLRKFLLLRRIVESRADRRDPR